MFEVIKYEEKYQERWDRFVMEKSMNGTFLHTRRFLNYHPKDRFTDASILIMQGANIVAVIPACDTVEEGMRCFFSHKGSTFGGMVINEEKYNINSMVSLFTCMEKYLRSEGFKKVVMKNTSNLFSKRNLDLFDYFFYYNQYDYYNEISLFIDCKNIPDDIVSTWSGSRRRGYRYAIKNNLAFRRLITDDDISMFYEMLCNNLRKYDTIPVHTLEELLEFRHDRLQTEVDFYGTYLNDKIVAGAMVFCFTSKVFHAQYFAQDAEYSSLYTMNFNNYQLIRLAKEKGFSYFSFGISTENRGKILNKSLAMFKEGFGSDYCVNRSYVKCFNESYSGDEDENY